MRTGARTALTTLVLLVALVDVSAWTPLWTGATRQLCVRQGLLDGIFGSRDEEISSLGKGVSVIKLGVAVNCDSRGKGSMLGVLEEKARDADVDTNRGLSRLVSDVCVELLRRKNDWVAAASQADNYAGGDGPENAEVAFNREVTKELAKFDKEYLPEAGEAKAADSTLAVVCLLLAIRGDRTIFDNVAGNPAATSAALQMLASDVLSEGGDVTVAAEVLWTPSDPEEVLTKQDVIVDYPELIDLY